MSGSEWGWVKQAQKDRRAVRMMRRRTEILNLKRAGYTVHEFTFYHYRINGLIDLFPLHNNWVDLRNQSKGGAQNLATWVKENLLHNET